MDSHLDKKENRLKATIDIGSNTVLLLVGKVHNEKVKVIYEEQQAPRLAKGVDENRNLDPDAVTRVLNVLKKYKSSLSNNYPNVAEVRVLATSAVRDAANRDKFVNRVKKETGFDVQILSGEKEAELTFVGAKSVLKRNDTPAAVIDIGGGSTEIAFGRGKKLIDRFSFDVGSVRFTERYLKDDPPSGQQLKRCENAIHQTISNRLFNLPAETLLIGVAGTVTSLAAIELGLRRYVSDRLNSKKLSRKQLSDSIENFSKMSSGERLKCHPEILEGRADVILAGLLILKGFMNVYEMQELVVSTGGIRHGALVMSDK